MRQIIALLVITFFGWVQQIHAQTKSINYIMVMDTAAACQNHLIISGYTGNYSEPQSVISIDWGDGTTSSHPFSAPAQSPFGVTAIHSYANEGIYTTATRVYNGVHDTWMDTTVYYQLTANPTACGTVHITTKKNDIPGYHFRDAPVDFKDSDGKITTITPHRNGYNSFYNYQGLNTAKSPYTATLNATWLRDHHLIQTNPPLTITNFNGPGIANPHIYQFLTACAPDTATIPNIRLENPMAYQFTTSEQKGTVHFDIRNLICSDTLNATVSIDFPSGCLPVMTGLTNPTMSGNTLTFKVNNVRSYSDSAARSIPFTFPVSTTAGTQFCFDIHISTPNETNLADNSAQVCAVVTNTYNPISKLVNLKPIIDSQKVETLTYKINFQNNYPDHYNVQYLKIVDTLSSNLDLSTFKVISSSHGVAIYLDSSTRIVTFTFHHADIVPSIYGINMSWDEMEIIYSASEKAGLTGGAAIDNTAYIYANYKPVIITNTTHNVNQSPLIVDEQSLEDILIFPNPAQDKLYFSGKINDILMYDTSGKLVLEGTNIQDDEISLNGLQSGFYQVVLKTESGVSNHKLLIKK